MGLETITDIGLRNNWANFIDLAHKQLKENQINVEFTTFKNDGSYSKAKTGIPATFFVFAQDSERTWVELEIKARTSAGQRYSQTELYSFLKKRFRQQSQKEEFPITWNEEDLQSSPRTPDGQDIRIKMYLKNANNTQWIKAMLHLIKSFLPLLQEYT